jgi:hypothetical protein
MALHAAGVAFIDGERNTQAQENSQSGGVQTGQAALALFVEKLKRYLASEQPYDLLSAHYRRIDEVVEVAGRLGMTEDAVRNAIVELYRAFVAEAEEFFSADLAMLPQHHDCAVAS